MEPPEAAIGICPAPPDSEALIFSLLSALRLPPGRGLPTVRPSAIMEGQRGETNFTEGKFMKIVAINGSPRKNGNTAQVLEAVRREVEAAGVEFQVFQPSAKVHPCMACYHCLNTGSASSGNYITAERAQQIALAETPSGSTVVKCQFDWDDGRAEYEVEIRNGWTEYDFEIDAVTGTIFSRDIDNDRYD